jgi:hypothetical protein
MVDKRKLRWFGNLIRMNRNRKTMHVWETRVEGSGEGGRAYAEAGEEKGEDLVKGKGQEGVPDLADTTWCLKEHKG